MKTSVGWHREKKKHAKNVNYLLQQTRQDISIIVKSQGPSALVLGLFDHTQ